MKTALWTMVVLMVGSAPLATSADTAKPPASAPLTEASSEMLRETAAAHYRAGRYVDALRGFRRLADAGDPRARTILGIMHSFGEGTPRDLAQARAWYEKAAADDYPPALYGLGLIYSDGGDVAQDLERASHWLSRAARLGHRAALERLRVVEPRAYAKVVASLPQTSPLPSREALLQLPSRRSQPMPSTAVRAARAKPRAQSSPRPPSAPASPELPQPGRSALYVQLVASGDEQHVLSYGRTLAAAHPDWFSQLNQRVERAQISHQGSIVSPPTSEESDESSESGKSGDTKPWYRLQVGPFANHTDALSFCQSIVAAEITEQCFLPR